MKKHVFKINVFVMLAIMAATLCANNQSVSLEYSYDSDGVLAGKAVNGRQISYRYDVRGQLLAVTDENGNELERYAYDPAGNRLSKTVGGKTTTYAYDEANQLISETTDGITMHYAYDAAGRMTRAGDKTYHYDGRGKLSEVRQNGQTVATFEYDIDGQLSKAVYGDRTEEFVWDGLALVWRSGVTYVNEPAMTGSNPILAGDEVLFNDMLGNTLSIGDESVEMTAFGETENKDVFFTGKPFVDELGYSFLFRNYSPEQGKWTSSDPMGYPDGWNNFAYGNNQVFSGFDFQGTRWVYTNHTDFFQVENYTEYATSPYEEVEYEGQANGNRGVAVVRRSATYARFNAHFLYTIAVPDNIIIENCDYISPATRHSLVMTNFDDGGSPDASNILSPRYGEYPYWFKLYSVTGYATYKFTYRIRTWEEDAE